MPETGDLLRYALKLATGTGKTVVMALFVTWATLHKRKVSGSSLSTNFLVLVPNLTVRDRVSGQPRGDVEDIRTLRHSDRFRVYVPSFDARVDFRDRSRMVESVLPGPQRARFPLADQIERIPGADDPRRLQQLADAHRGSAGRHIHKCLGVGPKRQQQQPIAAACDP